MAKQEKNTPLTPEELAQYRPEDPLPQLQSQFSLDLASTFKRAALDGAVVVRSSREEEAFQAQLPKVHNLTKEDVVEKELNKLIKRKKK